MSIESTGTMTGAIRDMYERTFLENLKQKFVFFDFADAYPVEKGFGPTVQFRRYTPKLAADLRADSSVSSADLTEGTVPSENQLVVESLSVTVKQKGNFVKLTDFLLANHISGYNKFVNQALGELAYQAKGIVDGVVRDAALSAAGLTSFFANGKANAAAMVDTNDLMTMNDVRKMVRNLKKLFVPFYDASNYVFIISPDQTMDILSETNSGSWIDANKYARPEMIDKGEVGKMYSGRFVESVNLTTQALGSGLGTNCVVLGKGALGVVDIMDVTKGDQVEMKHINLFIKEPGTAGTADPINQIATVGYKFQIAAKRLQDARIIQYVVGQSA